MIEGVFGDGLRDIGGGVRDTGDGLRDAESENVNVLLHQSRWHRTLSSTTANATWRYNWLFRSGSSDAAQSNVYQTRPVATPTS